MRRLPILALLGLAACGDVLYLGDEVRSVKVTIEGTTQEVSLEGLGDITVGRDEVGVQLDHILARASDEPALGYRIHVVTADGGHPAESPECQGVIPIDGAIASSVLLGNKLRNLGGLGTTLCFPQDVAELIFVRKGAELCEAAVVHTAEGLRRSCTGRSCWYCECALQSRELLYGDELSCGAPLPAESCTGWTWYNARSCLQDPERCTTNLDGYHRARCDETPK